MRLRFAKVASVLVTLVAVLAAGCTAAKTPESTPTVAASTTTDVRTDRDPIANRFPNLGAFTEAHWIATIYGSQDTSRITVPGATDVTFQALVVLSPQDRDAVNARYTWAPAADWGSLVDARLRPFLPKSDGWRYSDQFQQFIGSDGFTGAVLFEPTSGTVYVDTSTQ